MTSASAGARTVQGSPAGTIITPSAARLTESLRDIGYDFPAAVADVVDNSIMAGASRVDIAVEFDGDDSYVSIADDGAGMTPAGLAEALRYGSRRAYGPRDLGRYGLGLKTASMSQCRSLTVATRQRAAGSTLTVGTLDLDLISECDAWITAEPPGPAVAAARERLSGGPGTVVTWRKLDRVLPEARSDSGWARRRLESMARKTAAHLGIVFHRYLEGAGGRRLAITVNGQPVPPWNPFAPAEDGRRELPLQQFEVSAAGACGMVSLRRFVLPPRDEFSAPGEFERLSGPLKWNRQQGLYIYRAGRLVQWGGWNGIRGIDEHTKLGRASLDFDTGLDAIFNINVAKMRVTIPPQIRKMLERPVNELCLHADLRYRKASRRETAEPPAPADPPAPGSGAGHGSRPARPAPACHEAGLALRSAAMLAGEYDALGRILAVLGEQAPEIAAALGLDR